MKIIAKAVLTAVFGLAAAGGASAQVRFGIYAGVPQQYYPPAVQVQPQYVAPPGYYQEQEGYVVPDWRARQEWREMREREWRRAEWQRRQEWRRHQEWHHEQWHRDHWRQHGDRPYDRD